MGFCPSSLVRSVRTGMSGSKDPSFRFCLLAYGLSLLFHQLYVKPHFYGLPAQATSKRRLQAVRTGLHASVRLGAGRSGQSLHESPAVCSLQPALPSEYVKQPTDPVFASSHNCFVEDRQLHAQRQHSVTLGTRAPTSVLQMA